MSYDLLEGVKVVELSMYAFAPSAAAVLADWGANVIKVVPPRVADPMKGTPIAGLPNKDVGIAFMWEQLNRGKRCIGIDISMAAGRDILRRLLRHADIFITNLLPSARKRFGIDVEDIQAANPRLIYGRATAHGQNGPESASGGFDHTDFWARTGIAHAASMAVGEFVPQAGPAFGDLSSGAFLAGGIAAALYRRERTGRGTVVDVSLLSSGMWVFSPSVIASQLYEIETIPRLSHANQPNPLVTAYTTRDQRQVYLSGLQTDKNFTLFSQIIGRPELAEDPRFATGTARLTNARECIEALDAIFAQRELCEWVELLSKCPLPWAVVQTAAEAAKDPQVTANRYLVAVQGSGGTYSLVASPAQFDNTAPSLERAPDHGEHTERVLLELGLSWEELAALKSAGAVS